ncbi:hypothetical protein NTG1052_520003 [Candidatus Nitrotoga sp. 1052]|nr:hypothetical protein NTG1052_520003 [Candidatus Nitrotoga sp. 1052]
MVDGFPYHEAFSRMSSLGKPKADIMAALAKDINPDPRYQNFPARD